MPDQSHPEDHLSGDELHAVGLHETETGDAAGRVEFAAGAKLAREGKDLPTGATDSATEGFESVPPEEHGKPETSAAASEPAEEPEVVSPIDK